MVFKTKTLWPKLLPRFFEQKPALKTIMLTILATPEHKPRIKRLKITTIKQIKHSKAPQQRAIPQTAHPNFCKPQMQNYIPTFKLILFRISQAAPEYSIARYWPKGRLCLQKIRYVIQNQGSTSSPICNFISLVKQQETSNVEYMTVKKQRSQ